MKKLAMTLAAVLCCALTIFTSCKKADNQQEQKPDNSPAFVEATFTFFGTEDLVKYADIVVTYNDGTGEKTETVTTANWVKTIKTNLPASFSFSRKVTKKEGVTIDDNGVYSYVNAHLFHYEVFTADGVRIKEADAGGTGTPKDMKGQKFNFTITEGHLNASYSYSIDKDGKLPQTDPGK